MGFAVPAEPLKLQGLSRWGGGCWLGWEAWKELCLLLSK